MKLKIKMKMEMWVEWRPDRDGDGVESEDREGDRGGEGWEGK